MVLRRGSVLLQAGRAQAFAPILGGGPMADSYWGGTLLAGLEAQEGIVVQAVLIGPSLGVSMGQPDPARMTGLDSDKARAAIEAQIANPPDGVQLYGAAAVADLDGADGPFLAVVLAYPDCETAATAAMKAATLWPESRGGAVEGEAQSSHVDSGRFGCAAVITVPDSQGGRAFRQVMGAMWQRELAPLRISRP